MGLVELAKHWIEPKNPISAEAMRTARPTRNPVVDAITQDDGSILLRAPLLLQGRGYAGWLAKRLNAPDTKSFELEPVGAFVWSLCDGKNTFEAISRKLCAEYKMNRLESEASLSAFLRTLGQRRLVTLNLRSPK